MNVSNTQIRKYANTRLHGKLVWKVLLMFFFLFSSYSNCSAALKIKHIWEFGAVGDGITNDHDAFIDACRWFRDLNNFGPNDQGILYIGYYQYNFAQNAYTTNVATYKVGKQLDPGGTCLHHDPTQTPYANPANINQKAYKLGINVMEFINISNLTIETYIDGISNDPNKKAKIKFQEDMYFGAWLPPGYTFRQYSRSCVPSTCSTFNGIYTQYHPSITDIPEHGCFACTNPTCNCAGQTVPQGVSRDINYTIVGSEYNNSALIVKPGSWYEGLSESSDDRKINCGIGNILYLGNGCKNIVVRNLELDGNAGYSYFGARVGDVQIQMPYTGIVVFQGLSTPLSQPQNNQFEGLYIHDFGSDAMHFYGNNTGNYLEDCRLENNVRLGLGWVGGYNLNATNCHFSKNGKVYNIHKNGNVVGNPQSGIDIEPEDNKCTMGRFTNCHFIDNVWKAVSNDGLHDGEESEDVEFKDCEFHDLNGQEGVTVTGENFRFDHCTFNAAVNGVYRGKVIVVNNQSVRVYDPTKGTKFYNGCTFSDVPLNGNKLDPCYLFSTLDACGLEISDCQFIINDEDKELFNFATSKIAIGGLSNPSHFPIISNCNMTYNNRGNGASSLLSKVRFVGKNKIEVNGPQFCNGRKISLSDVFIEGGNDACSGSTLEFDGHIQARVGYLDTVTDKGYVYVGKKINLIDDGYATLRLKNGAILRGYNHLTSTYLELTHNLIVGEKGRVVIEEGSGYEAVDANIDGTLVINQGAYFHQNKLGNCPIGAIMPCTLNASTTAKIFIGSTVNPTLSPAPNNAGIPPLYYTPTNLTSDPGCGTIAENNNQLGCDWAGDILPTTGFCVYGSNNAYSTQACSTNYAYSSTAGAFTVFYNIIPTGTDFALNFITLGDAGAPYSYQLNGVPITIANNLIEDLETGCYLFYIADANGCAAWFNFTIGSPSTACCNVTMTNVNQMKVFSSPTASDLITSYSANTISNEKIYFVGDLTIDANISFVNCTLYFSQDAKITVNPNVSVTFNSSHLLAACNFLWDGIYASDPTSGIIVSNNSIIEDMANGIVSNFGAKVACQNSTFTDNNTSIHFLNTPAGYVTGGTGNLGVVTDCNFNSSRSFLLPPLDFQKVGEMGIRISQCKELRLGTLTNGVQNNFEHLFTGIYSDPWPLETTTTPPIQIVNNAGNVEVFNSNFNQLIDFEKPEISDKLSVVYIDPRGAGIYIDNQALSNNVSFDIKNVNQNFNFTNCDKGIVNLNANVAVEHVVMDDCMVGFVSNANWRNLSMKYSGVRNTLLGIQVLGKPSSIEFLQNNNSYGGIRLRETPYPPVISTYQYTPVGIDVQNYYNSVNADYVIAQNDITIDGKIGIGISANTTGIGTQISGNSVLFTETTALPNNTPIRTDLTAIQSVRGEGNSISCNLVYGISPTVFGQYNTTAIKLQDSKKALLECNQNNWTRFGISAIGNCATDKPNIKSNTMNNHHYGLITLPSVTGGEGDLSDIGLNTQDNNNRFLGAYANANGHRTYRYWSIGATVNAADTRSIFTGLIYANGSNVLNNPYAKFDLQPASNPQDCQELEGCYNDDHIPSVVFPFNIPQAEDIAEDELFFVNFPEVSQWIAEHELYAELDENSVLRNSSFILNEFYEENEFEPLGKFLDVEHLITELQTPAVTNNHSLFVYKLNLAKTTNNSISSSKVYETNLKWTNQKLLSILEFGWNNINVEDRTQIEILANSCPAVEGIGVYKARYLNSYLNPITTYNDYAICNPENKGGNGLYDDLMNFINGAETKPIVQESSQILSITGVTVYPVPASNAVTFQCTVESNELGTLTLFDLTGRVLQTYPVELNNKPNTIGLNGYANGLYNYVLRTPIKSFSGKISIVQ